ncbi:helicase-related protein [Streptomyces sp. DSM 41527]|uniref:Helicase-related protein n=1 Tax=Streptomyces mooreae TaxID=3075523 RepID=A0ABU2T7F5_9ACTN|nr:helicase-related protein [Streptomyces sp. DSM 41527]MDT0456736.1 helicase-related protein [Streptomyces sp. DSM 41527]
MQPQGTFERGQRVRVQATGVPEFATVRFALPGDQPGSWDLILVDDEDRRHEVNLAAGDTETVRPLVSDGQADSARVLAAMWTQWMNAAATNAESSAMAATPLKPYAHQTTAVYGAMLPQPLLRFLLCDEPGTGKTIMAGLYLREMQRLGLIKRAIIVCPANLATKWVDDFQRLLGGGLRQLTSATVREDALNSNDLWVVSLELAAVNPVVQDAIRPDKAGWDLVVFDEAHRLTPTAAGFHQVGRLLAKNTPRALLMTATPHRGKEWLFRHLLHLVDPEIYPDPGNDPNIELSALRPGPIHFLRRMKEDLVDYDGTTRLFKGRTARNHSVPLSQTEYGFYRAALEMVDRFFPPVAQPLARMVYGKRAASSLYALAETLRRRHEHMGAMSEAEAALIADREDQGDEAEVDEAKVIHTVSASTRAERAAINSLLQQIEATVSDSRWQPSKWKRLTDDCLAAHGIHPGNGEQAVVFTEYADSAEWIARRLQAQGYTAQLYSGRQGKAERDETRKAFMRAEFQIIVTTDAGNEGIDLQAAHVLVNYDIPWSLVRLEQRMGRIHRVGQQRDVYLYNLVATDTREGATLLRLLDNFVTAANELRGQMFDSLSAVAEITGVDYDKWLSDLYGNDELKKQQAIDAAQAVQAQELSRAARKVRDNERRLASQVDAVAALTLLQRDLFARINPAIVEAYLDRLAAAGVLKSAPTAAGPGFRRLSLSGEAIFPATLGGRNEVHVATSGDVVREASESIDIGDTVTLGPGEPGFSDLINTAEHSLAEDLYQSGAASDPTSLTPYDLYAYEATMTESNGKRASIWATLIKVDDSGNARPVRWESLANLVPTDQYGSSPHPAREGHTLTAAREVAAATVAEHRKVRADWFAQARRDLTNLPLSLTDRIDDRAARLELRHRLQTQTAQRLEELERLADVHLTEPKQVGRIRVLATADISVQAEIDAELVSMRHVQQLLEDDGWTVTDVHTEGRGYDLEVRRHSQVRHVEVKGVLGSAASDGIRMTGNEVLIATQHRKEYWLYVIDQCADGKGRFFGAYQDPATLFANVMTGNAVFRVPGSSLKNAPGSNA